jgi:prevent-host-death family protein
MGTITARELKQKTGDFIRRLRAGEVFTLTYRGKPIATIRPSAGRTDDRSDRERSDTAWQEIEQALADSEPRFGTWKEATEWVRGKIHS